MRRTMLVLGLALALLAVGGSDAVPAAEKGATHTIYGSLVEIKGGTTADKLAPPAVNPAEVSKA